MSNPDSLSQQIEAPEPRKATRTKPADKPHVKPKQPPLYSVVLHNDSINRFEWVVGVLQKTFGYGWGKAFLMTLRAHCFGRGVVWVGPFEVAEFKAAKLVGNGPDPLKIARGARPLKVSVEPVN